MIFKRRLLFWLFKAYLKKWGKIIALSFVVGLVAFFLLLQFGNTIFRFIQIERKMVIGIAGSYQLEKLPPMITQKLSRGLTKVTPDGTVEPDVAQSWETKNNGKTFIFHLKKDLQFSDGKPVTTQLISYEFTDVKVEKPDDYTLIFTLQDAYAPFLVTVSKPIFRKGFIGISEYKLRNVALNGQFLRSLQLVSTKNKSKVETYKLYPTTDALKLAFALGEVTKIIGLPDATFRNTSFTKFPNVHVEQKANYNQLVTIFYNTNDPVLSDKKLRSGLTYALPDVFPTGERAYLPYPPSSLFYNLDLLPRNQDFNHAQLLIDASNKSANREKVTVTIKTLEKHTTHAQVIAKAWKEVGIETKIEEVPTVPVDFQIFLGDFTVPKDPDQYTLWHSDLSNNITRFKNLRIDKLLEDGRKTFSVEDRHKIYADFQKYLLDEAPAAFLYFPYEYEVTRN